MNPSFRSAIARFGADAKRKLANLAATGQPEDQLRAPLERLVVDLAEVCGLPRTAVATVGESSLSELKTRPDFAVSVLNALVGFIEVKSPGKGADPRRFRDRHDKVQWEKLQSLPNLIYTDGNELSIWRSRQSGRQEGRPRHKATRVALALLSGEVDGLTRKAVELALAGDVTALRLCR